MADLDSESVSENSDELLSDPESRKILAAARTAEQKKSRTRSKRQKSPSRPKSHFQEEEIAGELPSALNSGSPHTDVCLVYTCGGEDGRPQNQTLWKCGRPCLCRTQIETTAAESAEAVAEAEQQRSSSCKPS